MSPHDELDRDLTAEQRTLKGKVRTFALDVLRPAAAALDRMTDPRETIAPGSPMWGALKAAYQQQLHTAVMPMDIGGRPRNGLSLHIVLEELGWGSADLAMALTTAGYPATVAIASGDAGLVGEFAKAFVADRQAQVVGCWGLTEAGRGSASFLPGGTGPRDRGTAGGVRARADGDAYVIDGQKADWITNGTIATHAVVHLSLDSAHGGAERGVALVSLDSPGVGRGPPVDKLGQRGLNQGSIAFNGVRIPRRNMVVDPVRYAAAMDATLAFTNAMMGAVFTGVARAAYEEAMARSMSREQDGQKLCEHQLVQKRLFEMYTRVEACRAFSRAALARNSVAGPPGTEASIAAKVFCTQAALEVADSAIQIFGGHGLVKGVLVEKLYRDARASLIESGSNDVLNLIGAHRILAQGTPRAARDGPSTA